MYRILIVICLALLLSGHAWAGKADVLNVTVRMTAPQTYAFDVTVQHTDTGWKHFANRWEVLAPDGSVLGTRVLMHPHENEQPFTRGLNRVKIPSHISRVTVRAHDLEHGWGGKTITVDLPKEK